ncbi:MAG: tRNA (guanine-N1)-methyltransferase [Candidatus Hydrothermarchaeota archaeon]|nr:MAG: tRNA (guanine-N1)-methyltransferase [Candidatus Hydrothermarchaeota archaeon]
MLGVKVKAREAEKVKKELKKLGVLDIEKKVKRSKDYIIFPITKKIQGYSIVEEEFETKKIKKFEDYLREFLTPEETKHVRHSFDIIGDIAIIEVPPELKKREKEIAEALAKAHKNIKAVYKKSSEVKGDERIRELKYLYGERKTTTIHKEHGIRLKLDITKVYFSPRLSYERKRILEQTKDGEVIVDLFAGVGPFSILLAKYRKVKVYAIDINPYAIKYLRENIKINKLKGEVIPLLGDCREVAPRNIATRVIMNLPKSSDRFLPLAFDVVKKGIIHFYTISPEENLYEGKVRLIKEIAKAKGKKIEIINKRIVRPYSPRNYHVVIDVNCSR